MDAGSDPRFSHVSTDPRFKSIPRRARKVQIDSRFRSMFSDKQFKVKYAVDKRGRKVNQDSSEDLRKYYQLDDAEEQASENKGRGTVSSVTGEEEGGEEKEEEGEEEEEEEEGASASDPSSDDSDDDSEDLSDTHLEEQVVHAWGADEAGVPQADQTGARLAVCNMDWDRITATDLYVLLSSFKPPGGAVQSVSIFPSDFGLERMRREDVEGPGRLVGGEGREGGGYSAEKLRQYQMERLKYYYAVVECDCKATAENVYEQCDGLEYERSGGKLDLRYIPADVSFEDRSPKEVASERLVPADFTPSEFFTAALQQSKVQLTWDETEPRRLQSTMRKFTKDDLQSMEFNAYLASSSSEEEEEVEGEEVEGEGDEGTRGDKKLKYKALLEEIGRGTRGGEEAEEEVEEEEELEMTWEPGLREGVEDLVKRRGGAAQVSTPWEKYLEKKKEKKREKKKRNQSGQKRAGEGDADGETELGFDDPFFQHEVTTATALSLRSAPRKGGSVTAVQEQEKSGLELLVMEEGEGEGEGGRRHFTLKGILKKEKEERQTKRRKRKAAEEPLCGDGFSVDVSDARFSALYASHHFAPDPSHPQYRPTKAMAAIMDERQRRRTRGRRKPEEGAPTSDPGVHVLARSVRRKAELFSEQRKKLRALRLRRQL